MFMNATLSKLNNAHLKVIMMNEAQFVGTRILTLSIKFICQALAYTQTRELIKPHIEKILFNISLPLFLASEKEMETFNNDPTEYVRLQVDITNECNVKKQLSKFVQSLCSLKYGKKNDKKSSIHLSNYLQVIGTNL
jgi:hypothetical protein